MTIQEEFKRIFDYIEIGRLVWKIRPANRVKIGDMTPNAS